MHPAFTKLVSSLQETAKQIKAQGNPTQPLRDRYGWHHPALSPNELAHLPERLAQRIAQAAPDQVSDTEGKAITMIASRLDSMVGDTLPHVFNGNGVQALAPFMATLYWAENSLEPYLQWHVPDAKAIPAQLAKRLKNVQLDIETLTQDSKTVGESIKIIREAHEAAEALPVDLRTLQDAKKKIENTGREIGSLAVQSEIDAGVISKNLKAISDLEEKAAKLVQQCEDAYRITTSKGLAGAFQLRSTQLENTVWIWVLGLLVALVFAVTAGGERLSTLSTELRRPDVIWSVIWMQAFLSVVSFGAPIWFGWLATKQIGQRFRLAEDYAFKAAVAKAYEGYRREAATLDPKFSAKLFDSALNRLDEAPLRWVEADSHGSPWHELVESEPFKKALDVVPSLRGALAKARQRKSKSASKPVGEEGGE